MVTYKTLEDFLNKVLVMEKEVQIELRSTRDHLRYLEDSNVSFRAQIETLKQLMDVEHNPGAVEIPAAGEDDIQELFDKRLGIEGNPDAEEMRKLRQEGVYTKEATGIVEQIDAINNE